MSPRWPVVFLLAVSCVAATPAANASAVLVVAEDGGFPIAAVRTVRSLTATELRTGGVVLLDEPRFHEPTGIDADTLAALAREGVERLFVLRLGRLDQKVLVTLEELQPPASVPRYATTHAAASLDEADIVIPRLVRSVLERQPFETSARMPTLTAQEAAPFRSRPGEGLFVIGVGLAPLGGSLGWSYEARSFRLGVLAQGADEGASFFGIDAAWLPMDGNVSPYVGVGFGVVGGGEMDEAAVAGTKLEAGVEFFRLHKSRLMFGVSAIIPFETLRGVDDVSWGLQLRAGF